jgi:hypothetical protein
VILTAQGYFLGAAATQEEIAVEKARQGKEEGEIGYALSLEGLGLAKASLGLVEVAGGEEGVGIRVGETPHAHEEIAGLVGEANGLFGGGEGAGLSRFIPL